jgi:type VI protein secretion system component VasK
MSAFSYELASVHAAVLRAHPASPKGIYTLPWYLVIGDPTSGRTAAIHAMNLTWRNGDGPLKTGVPTELSTYWMPEECVIIEPESTVLGPRRNPAHLGALCEELHKERPREPVDGILLVLSVLDFIELDEERLQAYATAHRKYLVEVGRHLHADVPVYIILTRYDTVWGFAEVFQWSAERAREEPWGFTLPPDTPSQESLPRILKELDGLNARLEANCLWKLAGEDPPESRNRAFQHLAEVRAVMEKLREIFRLVAMTNSFERAPWIRAMVVGCSIPGSGDKLRAGVARFVNMGYVPGPSVHATNRPGGLPIHAFLRTVVLPEKDLVPLRTRWRDDLWIVITLVVGIALLIGAGVATAIFTYKAR